MEGRGVTEAFIYGWVSSEGWRVQSPQGSASVAGQAGSMRVC